MGDLLELVKFGLASNWKLIGVSMGVVALPLILPNAIVRRAGAFVGKACSVILRQRIGRAGEAKVEGWVTGTLQAFVVEGMIPAMLGDNEGGGEDGGTGSPR